MSDYNEKAKKHDPRTTVEKLQDMGFDPVAEMIETYKRSKTMDINEIDNPIELLKFRTQTAKDLQNIAFKEEEIRLKKKELNKGQKGDKTFYIPSFNMVEENGKLIPKKVMQIESENG